jgi:DNA-directed RNA polymerase specialized sigma subunit
MSNDIFCDVYDSEEINELLKRSREGDKTSQKILYRALENAAKPIQYSYFSRCRKCGVNRDDLDGLCARAFLICFNRFDKKLGNLYIYYKYTYANLVKAEIRHHLQKTYYENYCALGINQDCFEEEREVIAKQQENEIKKFIENDEVFDLITNNVKVNLNAMETNVLKFYINDYTLKEISRKLNLKYSQVNYAVKTGLEKISKYISLDKIMGEFHNLVARNVAY